MAVCGNMTFACDGCSIAQTGGLLGLAPKFKGHFVGLNYGFRSFSSFHPQFQFSEVEEGPSSQVFHSMEFSARIQAHDRIQIFAFLPYLYSSETDVAYRFSTKGAGDATVLLNYFAFQSDPENVWQHSVEVNTGLKMPTGKFRIRDGKNRLNPSLQPGSGSWDVPFGFRYTVRKKTWGAAVASGYWLNTVNSLKHRFGNRVYAQVRGFKLFNIGSVGVVPQFGLMIEHSGKEQNLGQVETLSGGHNLNLQSAIRANVGQWSFTAAYDHSLHNNLSNNLVQPEHQFNISIHLFI